MFFLKPRKITLQKIEERLEVFERQFKELVSQTSHINELSSRHHHLLVENYLQQNLYSNPKYQASRRLNRFEYQVFSQFGEDGIIAEIFNRIGTTNKFFVEFGVENGTECNTTRLLLNGWQGLWLEGNMNHANDIRSAFKQFLHSAKLTLLHAFINVDNVETLFTEAKIPLEPDLLSIDIDRNDYHIWNAIVAYRPRVIIIEYNAIYRPGDHFVVPYDAGATWDGSSHFGASLEAYYQLGLQKGYKLVGCNFSGVNAFFVREDLVAEHFESPHTPETYYEPARYYLYKKDGHFRKIAP